MQQLRSRLAFMALAVIGYVFLVLPAHINGAPFYWPDSFAYLHGGSSALSIVTGAETRYSGMERAGGGSERPVAPSASAGAAETPAAPSAAQPAAEAPEREYRISSARSPYYSVLLAGSSSAAGMMAPVYGQALLVIIALVLMVRGIFQTALIRPMVFMTVALALTSAGLFASFLLPDVLAPLTVIALGMLFATWSRMGWLEMLFWAGLLCLSILSHSTHLALVVLLLPFAALMTKVFFRRPVLGASLVTIATIGVGISGMSLFSYMVERKFGYAPQSFPMIAASIIVDGTGRDYLEATCPESGFVYCDYRDTKATKVDHFLWSSDPERGVYQLVDTETQIKMSEQQWDFLIATLQNDFWGQVAASSKRMFEQIANNSLKQFSYSDKMRATLSALPEPDRSAVINSAGYRDRFPFQEVGLAAQIVGWAALLAMIYAMQTAFRTTGPDEPVLREKMQTLLLVSLIVGLSFLVNAGMTGAASQPQGRYGARLLLLFPILSGLWFAALTMRRSVQAKAPLDGAGEAL